MRKKTIIWLLTAVFALVFASQAQAATLGIDVSRWQGTIDWDTASQNAGFALIKAGGSDVGFYTDGEFKRNQEEARRVGIAHGYYYFAGAGDPIQEAEHFASITGELQPGEVVAIDYEIDHPVDSVAYVEQFMAKTEELLGAKPILYTNMNRVWGLDWSRVAANGNPLWGALYDQNSEIAPDPGAWPALTIKQFSSDGAIPGIPKRVDLNVFAGNADEFKALGKDAPEPPAAPASSQTPVPLSSEDPEMRPLERKAGGLYDPSRKREPRSVIKTGDLEATATGAAIEVHQGDGADQQPVSEVQTRPDISVETGSATQTGADVKDATAAAKKVAARLGGFLEKLMREPAGK